MGVFTSELRKLQMVLLDRITQGNNNPDEAWQLAQTSRDIPKEERVVVVDSDLAYGNARALALDLAKELPRESLVFISYDNEGLQWAKNHGLEAYIFSTKSSPENSELWNLLLRAKVSVYDSHDWWRNRDQLILRSLLFGSHKIQLWHGATGPVGKVFGLERLSSAPTWWHFVAVSTSSGIYDQLVNEPSQAEYRRNRSMLAKESIHDVEYRLVEPMASNSVKPSEKRILIAPTYSESVAGEDALIKWVKSAVTTATSQGWAVAVAVHPGAKPRVSNQIKKLSGIEALTHGIETADLKNYRAVITDFSGIAHDALMCDVPTVSVLIDFENYQSLCPALIDDVQMNVAYVVENSDQLASKIIAAVNEDPLALARKNYIDSVITELSNDPGVNTRAAVKKALRAN